MLQTWDSSLKFFPVKSFAAAIHLTSGSEPLSSFARNTPSHSPSLNFNFLSRSSTSNPSLVVPYDLSRKPI
jgi:hypothetical protein